MLFRVRGPHLPTSTSSTGSITSSLDVCFEGDGSHCSTREDSDSDSGDSEATLEDIDAYQFGHPLQRIFRLDSIDECSMFRSTVSSPTSSSVSSSTSFYDTHYEALVDRILIQNPSFTIDASSMLMFDPSSPGVTDSVMIKCFLRDSLELRILIELNHPERRHDPWNPAPHIRAVVERDKRALVVMERLSAYDDPPFKTVANYADFFRQILEGLTFMHELSIAKLSFQEPSSCMVDLSSAPSSCLLPSEFDRARYPVKYYFTDFSLATKFDIPSSSGTRSPESEFRRDVQDCALKIDRLLTYIPQVALKFKTLVKAMTIGNFGAEDSRKLFEALCKSLDSSIFDTPVAIPEPCVRCKSSSAFPTRTATPIKQSLSS